MSKIVPVAFCLVLLADGKLFSITESHPSRPGQQSCYRRWPERWLCAWEPSPGEKRWQTNLSLAPDRHLRRRHTGSARSGSR
jgi:uncharacterized protein YjeT (DUF2065 family)